MPYITYDQWKDPTDAGEWEPPSHDDGMPTDDQYLDAAVAEAKTSPDEVHDALLGMIGLVQLICARDDVPDVVKQAMATNHRYLDAREVAKAYL